MKTVFALAVLGATAALGLALGPASRTSAEPLRPSVVRYVNLNQIIETAERFREEREAMTKRWEAWSNELQELGKQGQALEKERAAFTGLKTGAEYAGLVERLEVLGFQLSKRRERYTELKGREQTDAILKWSEEIELAIAGYAKANGIDVVLQNWVAESEAEDGLSTEERYRRIMSRSAVHLDPALDITKAIAEALK